MPGNRGATAREQDMVHLIELRRGEEKLQRARYFEAQRVHEGLQNFHS